MRKLTLDGFKSIWKSQSLIENTEFEITLYYNNGSKAGNLWYIDAKTNTPIYIAEGDFELINTGNDTYQLSIGDIKMDIRLYMPDDKNPSFDMNIPNFGYVRFIGKRD